MAKRFIVIGAKPKRIEIVDQPKPRTNPAELASALGAAPSGEHLVGISDPLAIAELGTQLLSRLQSSGGRPALVDATVNCRVPLSADDVRTLEALVAQVVVTTGAKPSVGQMVSIIIRKNLAELAPELRRIELTSAASEMESVLPGWGSLFPNVPDLQKVTARARSVARRAMPLMMTDAA